MKLDDIHYEWEADAKIDETELDSECRRIPVLHSKYIRFLSGERMTLRKLEHEARELETAVRDRLNGVMTKEDLEARGWEPERRKFLRDDLNNAVATDSEVVELKLRISLQHEKVDVLEAIVKMIANRNFVIKSMIDWIKFKTGAL